MVAFFVEIGRICGATGRAPPGGPAGRATGVGARLELGGAAARIGAEDAPILPGALDIGPRGVSGGGSVPAATGFAAGGGIDAAASRAPDDIGAGDEGPLDGYPAGAFEPGVAPVPEGGPTLRHAAPRAAIGPFFCPLKANCRVTDSE